MSAFVAVAMKTVGCDDDFLALIMDFLDLPDFVKRNIPKNLIPYLRAIALDGYDTYKRRKMMIVGNTSKFK